MSMGAMFVQFVIALLFMGAAAAIGYVLSRHKHRTEYDERTAMQSGETAKWRRRATIAEDRARAAETALTRERRRVRR